MSDILFASIENVSRELRSRQVSPVELTAHSLQRIERYDPEIHAFISVFADRVMDQARAAEAEITAGNWRGYLHGVPVAIKDLIDIAGEVTSAGSGVFAENIARDDADVVRSLKNAGAIIIGKTNLHEFAFGGSGVISAHGPVANPWDLCRTTGGSSSGSAAAVAAGMCFAALGTDTAGSIRLPASYCGLVGLKPGWGAVSARGVVPLSESLDHVGPITRTVGDAEIVLRQIAPAVDNSRKNGREVHNFRVAVARTFFFDELDSEIRSTVEQAFQMIESLTHELRQIEVPMDPDRSVFNYEVWRFHGSYVERTPELYDPRTLERIRACAATKLAAYEHKKRVLDDMRLRTPELFRDADVILTPTVPITPPLLKDLVDSPGLRASELLMLRNTRPWNILGLPTISIPCGLTPQGLPVGLQITAANEHDCIGFAKLCEEAFAFKLPPLPQ